MANGFEDLDVTPPPVSAGPLPLPTIASAPPVPGVPVPTQEEIIAKLQSWRDAFARMQNDPSFNAGMLRLGMNLMQPVQPGNTAMGNFGAAVNDAVQYTNQRQGEEQNRYLKMQEGQQRERQVAEQERSGAETRAASQQQRAITSASAPVALATAQVALDKAKADMRLIQAEEASGNRSPEFLQRRAVAEAALREALARMYDAHAAYYRDAGQAQDQKGKKQTLNVRQMDDGSIVSTVVVNGEPTFHQYTPPRFSDAREARAQATKDVDKVTPSGWNPFAGPAPYTGTREQEIDRLTKEYMKPKLTIFSSKGELTPQQYEAMGGPPAPSAAQPMPPAIKPESRQEATAAGERSLGIIRMELRDAIQKGAAPETIAALRREEERAVAGMQRAQTNRPPEVAVGAPTPAPDKFVRDANNNIVPVGRPAPAAAPAPTPVATPETPMETAGLALERAREMLQRARSVLATYGAKKQRNDPQGYRNALIAVKTQQDAVNEAQTEYEGLAMPGLGAVTGRTFK